MELNNIDKNNLEMYNIGRMSTECEGWGVPIREYPKNKFWWAGAEYTRYIQEISKTDFLNLDNERKKYRLDVADQLHQFVFLKIKNNEKNIKNKLNIYFENNKYFENIKNLI